MNYQVHHQTMMHRRRLLALGMLLAPGVALAGCSSFLNLTPSQLQQDAQTLINEMSAVWTYLSSAGVKMPANVLTQAQTLINAVQNNAQAIVDAIKTGNAVSTVATAFQAVMAAINALAPLIATFYPPAAGIIAAIQAAITVAQLLLQESGLFASAKLKAISPADADAARRLAQEVAAHGIAG